MGLGFGLWGLGVGLEKGVRLRTTYYVLRTTYCVLRTAYCVLCTTYYVPRTTYYVLRTMRRRIMSLTAKTRHACMPRAAACSRIAASSSLDLPKMEETIEPAAAPAADLSRCTLDAPG